MHASHADPIKAVSPHQTTPKDGAAKIPETRIRNAETWLSPEKGDHQKKVEMGTEPRLLSQVAEPIEPSRFNPH